MNRKMIARELLALARELVAMDFPTQDAMDKYLKDHPDADRGNHKVVETKKEAPAKKEAPKMSREDEDHIADTIRDELMGTKKHTSKAIAVKALKDYMSTSKGKNLTDAQVGRVWDSMVKDGYLKKTEGGFGWNDESEF